MSRKPRAKLPEPAGYTTIGGRIGVDLFLIRTARDLSKNSSFYQQLEARCLDAELVGLPTIARRAGAIAYQQLHRIGLTITPIAETGVVLHRVDLNALSPRLRTELDSWTPPPGSPPSKRGRESVVPWMLLARLPLTTTAIRTHASDIEFYRDRHLHSRAVLMDRVKQRFEEPAECEVARIRSHIAELGQPRYLRYTHFDRKVVADPDPAPATLPESLIGIDLQGTRQEIARGAVSAGLSWSKDQAVATLTVTISPGGSGRPTRYEIPLDRADLVQALDREVSTIAADTALDEDWENAEQVELDLE